MAKNTARSGFTAIQVGSVGPKDAKKAKNKPEAKGSVVNVCTGGARVGVQADVVVGDLTIDLSR
ncbi:hypothetical protein [Nonomuraea sp. NPDC050540]|uniref:hypothetical protein n=1 Tax=Nonomuraea sp. NPDC050540 TaxID=3364367 RepID=UPI0037A663CC